MKAEIIAVGDEVVLGHVVNTNASFLAEALRQVGVIPQYHTAVCDEEKMIKEVVHIALKRAELIILTGGLGPTEDDMTKEAVCQVLHQKLQIIPEEVDHIKKYFEEMKLSMPGNNVKQAMFPEKAKILPNYRGTAPGCILEEEGNTIILLPGPPQEMKHMFLNSVLPYLKEKNHFYTEHIDIRTFGMGESALALKLKDLLGNYEWGSIATYIGNYEVIVRITVYGKEEARVKTQIQQAQKRVERCLEAYIIGYNDEKLEQKIVTLLKERHLHVATIESCTGGLLSAALTHCEGASTVFNEGIIAYSNDAKLKYVGVKEETIKSFGAVSEQTVREMAEGIRLVSGVEIGIAATGIAGPGGGTSEKPVGLVYIGIATKEMTYTHCLHLTGTRTEIREKTVKHILFRLYQKLCEK